MKALLILEYSNGSLPPPYAYTYKISFFKTGYAQFEVFERNNEDLREIHSENKSYSLETLQTCIHQLNENPPKTSELMVGGEHMKIIFEKHGTDYEISVHPNDEIQKENFQLLQSIYDEHFEKHKNEIIKKLYNN